MLGRGRTNEVRRKKPTKTECQRWLDRFGKTEKKVADLWKIYKEHCAQQLRPNPEYFGQWMYAQYKPRFDAFYAVFIKTPEKVEEVYA